MVERCHSERYALTDLAQPFEEALQLGLVPLRASRRSQIQSPVVVVAAHPLPAATTSPRYGPCSCPCVCIASHPASSHPASTVETAPMFYRW
jgi:hypothetical protein